MTFLRCPLMLHNILCTVKQFESYETIGALFADATDESLELSVTDKIWELTSFIPKFIFHIVMNMNIISDRFLVTFASLQT
mgnify:CR=1 FL=1